MKREYKILAIFAGIIAVLILLFLPAPIWAGNWVKNVSMAIAYICGTVGDPFKDTAGPSINTQITVVSLVASLLSGLFVAFNLFG